MAWRDGNGAGEDRQAIVSARTRATGFESAVWAEAIARRGSSARRSLAGCQWEDSRTSAWTRADWTLNTGAGSRDRNGGAEDRQEIRVKPAAWMRPRGRTDGSARTRPSVYLQ